jgi:hypothetical protein
VSPPKKERRAATRADEKLQNTLCGHSRKVNETFGAAELCAWRCWSGACRFQTTSPAFARKLAQRSGATLVGYAVTGGYLRIFQEAIEPWRARKLVTRYVKAANRAFSSRDSVPSTSGPRGSVTIAAIGRVMP